MFAFARPPQLSKQLSRKSGKAQVTFEYRKGAADGPKATLLQHGWVKDTEKGTTWAVCACLAPHCTRSHCTRSHCIC
jgi:hypothetical protein